MDVHDKKTRSYNMSRIKGKDTLPEVMVRRYLFSKGFRYRKNDKRLPGTPDVVLPKYHTVVFVHGCYWHRHKGCRYATTPSSNSEFWNQKFLKNVANDSKNNEKLVSGGWHVLVVWECEVRHNFEETMRHLITQIQQNQV